MRHCSMNKLATGYSTATSRIAIALPAYCAPTTLQSIVIAGLLNQQPVHNPLDTSLSPAAPAVGKSTTPAYRNRLAPAALSLFD